MLLNDIVSFWLNWCFSTYGNDDQLISCNCDTCSCSLFNIRYTISDSMYFQLTRYLIDLIVRNLGNLGYCILVKTGSVSSFYRWSTAKGLKVSMPSLFYTMQAQPFYMVGHFLGGRILIGRKVFTQVATFIPWDRKIYWDSQDMTWKKCISHRDQKLAKTNRFKWQPAVFNRQHNFSLNTPAVIWSCEPIDWCDALCPT